MRQNLRKFTNFQNALKDINVTIIILDDSEYVWFLGLLYLKQFHLSIKSVTLSENGKGNKEIIEDVRYNQWNAYPLSEGANDIMICSQIQWWAKIETEQKPQKSVFTGMVSLEVFIKLESSWIAQETVPQASTSL